MDKSLIETIKFKTIMIKKNSFGIIRIMLSLLFIIYGCESQNTFENIFPNVSSKAVRSISDSTFYCPVNVYANTVQNYMYNTGDLPGYDYIAFYIDKSPSEDWDEYPDTITLRNDSYHNSGIRLPYGKHHITAEIILDDGNGIFENCATYVTSITNNIQTSLYKQDIDARDSTGSATNAEFQFEFDIDVPYSSEYTDQALDIRLMFNEGLKDPNYITGRALIRTYYDWDTSLDISGTTWWDFSIEIVDYPTGNVRTFNKSDYDYTRNGVSNISYQFKSLLLPLEDDVNYNLYLKTGVSAGISTIFKDSEISWYSAYYREKFDEDYYSDWYPIDELTPSYIGIDATIDFYSDLEIVCFKSKAMYDRYAPSLGIDY